MFPVSFDTKEWGQEIKFVENFRKEKFYKEFFF